MKAVIKENRVLVSKYGLSFTGVGKILFTSIGSLEEELDKVDLPDRTSRSGGRKKQLETDLKQPLHHDEEIVAMERWFTDCQDPVAADHLKTGTLILFDQQGRPRRSYTLHSCWVMKRALPELEMDNDGDMAEYTWSISIDQVTKAP